MSEQLDINVKAVADPEAVFVDADIMQAATNSGEPVFEDEWIEPGTHVGVIRSQEPPNGFFNPEAFDAFVQSWSHVTQLEELDNQFNERTISTKNVNNYVVEDDDPVPKFEEFDQEGEPLCDWSAVAGLGDLIASDEIGRSSEDGITVFTIEVWGYSSQQSARRFTRWLNVRVLARPWRRNF